MRGCIMPVMNSPMRVREERTCSGLAVNGGLRTAIVGFDAPRQVIYSEDSLLTAAGPLETPTMAGRNTRSPIA